MSKDNTGCFKLNSFAPLTYQELFKIGFGAKTVRRYRISEGGDVHVLRLSSEWVGTLHDDLTMWLIFAERSREGIKNLWDDVRKEGELTNGRVAFYDLGDATELPIILEILLLSDGKLAFDACDYGYRESATGYIGVIVGNGLQIDLYSGGMAGLVTCIIANHIGPKTEFLKDACERVDRILSELKKSGFQVHSEAEAVGGC